MSEPKLRVASGSQEDPGQRREEQEAPREIPVPLTTEALAARGDSLQHFRRRVAVSISRSACPAFSSMAVEGSEEQKELRRRMDEYLLHEEYYKFVQGEDGEEPLEALGSPPHTDMGSLLYSGQPADLADTVSLPGRRRGPVWRPELPTPSRNPEVCPAYAEDYHLRGPPDGALDRTAELLAKLLSGSEDPDVTALSEAIKAKLGITEPLPKPALASSSPGLSTLADDLKRSTVSRLLPKVTCPSPFHPSARTVPIAELQDVPVTETEKKGLTALAPLAGVPSPPSGLTPGGQKSGNAIAQANIKLKLPEFAEFLLITGQSHVDVATKCSLLKRSCKKNFLQKQVKQVVKTCSTWAEVLQRLEKTFRVYETDLSVRTQIEELPMLPEFPSAAQFSENVCDLEYLFSRMNVGSYWPHRTPPVACE